VIQRIQNGQERGKMHSIIVVAEGVCSGEDLKNEIKAKAGLNTNVIVLGYLQRGGHPTAYDRMMASRMGARAVDLLLDGEKGLMVGWKKGQLVNPSFAEAAIEKHEINLEDYSLARSISI